MTLDEARRSAPPIFNYDPETGVFTTEGLADLDEVLFGMNGAIGWIVPAFATLIRPPVAGAKQAARFRAEMGAWDLIPDRRGEQWRNGGQIVTIDFVGDPTSFGFVEDPAIAADAGKAALRAYVAARRYAFETGGVTYGGKVYASDRESQGMVSGAVLLSQYVPEGATFNFKRADGGFEILNVAGLIGLGLALGAHVQLAFTTESAALGDINAGVITTTAEIDARFGG